VPGCLDAADVAGSNECVCVQQSRRTSWEIFGVPELASIERKIGGVQNVMSVAVINPCQCSCMARVFSGLCLSF